MKVVIKKNSNVQPEMAIIKPITPLEIENRLLDGQSCGAVFVACSEMGARLSCVPSAPDLNILTFQNIGNCIDQNLGLEEMVETNKISDIFVLGHYPCEFVRIQLDNDVQFLENSTSSARRYFNEQTASLKIFIENNKDKLDRDTLFRNATEQHILDQLLKLKLARMPQIDSNNAKQGSQLQLHAWLWLDSLDELLTFDSTTGRFMP